MLSEERLERLWTLIVDGEVRDRLAEYSRAAGVDRGQPVPDRWYCVTCDNVHDGPCTAVDAPPRWSWWARIRRRA
jgi:hypothetical protein